MKGRGIAWLTVAVIAGCTAWVLAQGSLPAPKPKEPPLTVNLRHWIGQDCIVYLRIESDPRSGRSSYSTSMSDGLRQIDEMPVSVSGSLASVEDAAIVKLTVRKNVGQLSSDQMDRLVPSPRSTYPPSTGVPGGANGTCTYQWWNN